MRGSAIDCADFVDGTAPPSTETHSRAPPVGTTHGYRRGKQTKGNRVCVISKAGPGRARDHGVSSSSIRMRFPVSAGDASTKRWRASTDLETHVDIVIASSSGAIGGEHSLASLGKSDDRSAGTILRNLLNQGSWRSGVGNPASSVSDTTDVIYGRCFN